jgi:hypothetical protein
MPHKSTIRIDIENLDEYKTKLTELIALLDKAKNLISEIGSYERENIK